MKNKPPHDELGHASLMSRNKSKINDHLYFHMYFYKNLALSAISYIDGVRFLL